MPQKPFGRGWSLCSPLVSQECARYVRDSAPNRLEHAVLAIDFEHHEPGIEAPTDDFLAETPLSTSRVPG